MLVIMMWAGEVWACDSPPGQLRHWRALSSEIVKVIGASITELCKQPSCRSVTFDKLITVASNGKHAFFGARLFTTDGWSRILFCFVGHVKENK